MRLSQVFAITVSGLLGMGIATAIAVFMHSGNRYHLSLGVDSGENFTVHPMSLPSIHDTTDSGRFEVEEDSTAYHDRRSPSAEQQPSLSRSDLEPVLAAPDPTESRLVNAVASDHADGGYLRAATWTSESSWVGDISLEILERQTDEIRKLTRRIEMLQKVMMEKPFDSAARSRVPRAWANPQGTDSHTKDDGNERLADLHAAKKVGPSNTEYARNCAEIERLLDRMERMKQQLEGLNESTTASPTTDRDQDPEVLQSEYVEEERDEQLPGVRSVTKDRPFQMRIEPASRSRR